MIILFLSSSLHHAAKSEKGATEMLRRLDHVAIYCFIAGSYTPYCVVSVQGAIGMRVLLLVWIMALAGAYQKIFFKVTNLLSWFGTELNCNATPVLFALGHYRRLHHHGLDQHIPVRATSLSPYNELFGPPFLGQVPRFPVLFR